MNVINDVYDVIDAVRKKRNMSIRQLALCAGIPPTTLVSNLSRKPKSIDKDLLMCISEVLDVPWYDFLNKTESFVVQYDFKKRIPILLSAEDISVIKDKIAQLPDSAKCNHQIQMSLSNQNVQPKGRSMKFTYNDSILFILSKLNEDGIIEAMRKLLDVAADPKYRKKEDD